MLILGILAFGSRKARADDLAFLTVSTDKETYFVLEPIRVRIRFGIEVEVSKTGLIQLFRRRLDLPVQVTAPWVEELSGAVLAMNQKKLSSSDPSVLGMVLNDGQSLALRIGDQQKDNNIYHVFEVERTYLVDEAGVLEVPGSSLRFAFATSFEEDFLSDRVPVDRHDRNVEGAPHSVRVQELPIRGRPVDFSGAVGQFSVEARVGKAEVIAGESLKLQVTFSGTGNFGHFQAPDLSDLRGFHVYGKIEEYGQNELQVTYDLAPLSGDVEEIPSIPFYYFDPDPPGTYRVVNSLPLPLLVQGPTSADEVETLPPVELKSLVPGETDIFGLKAVAMGPGQDRVKRGVVEADEELSGFFLAFVVFTPWLLWLGFLSGRRAFGHYRGDPESVRARRAIAAFRARVHRSGFDLCDGFAEFLSARLRFRAPAVIDPNLRERLSAVGISTELSNRAASMMETLVGCRYGSGISPAAAPEVESLVKELELAFQTMEEEEVSKS